MKLNRWTAELCGIILGDGNLHKKYNRITISGSSDDIFYFEYHVIPIFRLCFPKVNPRIVYLKNQHAYNLEVENKQIFEFFVKMFGLKRGPKDDAGIPRIISSNPAMISHFIRGLFDTDGCIKFCKQTRVYPYYPRIRFALMESPLSHELGLLIRQTGFPATKDVRPNHGYSSTKNLITYEISGREALEQWMSTIKPANPVHIAKYVYWKRHGFHIPYIKLLERVARINGKDSDVHLDAEKLFDSIYNV